LAHVLPEVEEWKRIREQSMSVMRRRTWNPVGTKRKDRTLNAIAWEKLGWPFRPAGSQILEDKRNG